MSVFDKRLPRLACKPDSLLELSKDYFDLLYALRFRSLSHLEDETISMAPILGLDRGPLLDQKSSIERIKPFFDQWKAIPSYIIFREATRIDQPGYRWMPESFVRGVHKSVVPLAPD